MLFEFVSDLTKLTKVSTNTETAMLSSSIIAKDNTKPPCYVNIANQGCHDSMALIAVYILLNHHVVVYRMLLQSEVILSDYTLIPSSSSSCLHKQIFRDDTFSCYNTCHYAACKHTPINQFLSKIHIQMIESVTTSFPCA